MALCKEHTVSTELVGWDLPVEGYWNECQQLELYHGIPAKQKALRSETYRKKWTRKFWEQELGNSDYTVKLVTLRGVEY